MVGPISHTLRHNVPTCPSDPSIGTVPTLCSALRQTGDLQVCDNYSNKMEHISTYLTGTRGFRAFFSLAFTLLDMSEGVLHLWPVLS
jgi:hypothetical protein